MGNCGTPAFMPMESFGSSLTSTDFADREVFKHIVISRDWYALGCCLMLMLYGERCGRIVQSHRGGILVPPPHDQLERTLNHMAEEQCCSVDVIDLVHGLTAESALRRAGAAELRECLFFQ